MNAKNIILAISMVLSFAACTSEIEGIDNTMTDASVNSNRETSLSVRMVSNGNNTKSATADADGLAISNFIIAVFESESGERIGYTKGTASSSSSGTVILPSINTKEGTADVMVIANLSEADQALFNNLYTYDEFAGQPVGSLERLVKVGVSKGVKLTKNATATVELEQLTARVQVNMSAIVDGAGTTGTTASMAATAYTANVSNSSNIIAPGTSGGTEVNVPLDKVSAFSYGTYKVTTTGILVSVEISIKDAAGKEMKNITKEINVPFNNGAALTLENGKAYSIDVEASISVKCDVSLSYTVHAFDTIEQSEITFN